MNILDLAKKLICYSLKYCKFLGILTMKTLVHKYNLTNITYLLCRKRAISKGVQVLAKEVVWEEEVCYLGKSLPVAFDPEVDHLAIDDAHLQSVLVRNSAKQYAYIRE